MSIHSLTIGHGPGELRPSQRHQQLPVGQTVTSLGARSTLARRAGDAAPMTAVVLAALAALAYGASDFSGAVAAKVHDATLVTVCMQAVSLVALLGYLVLWPEETRTLADASWAALGGIAVAVALTSFYQALARGPMSTAAALTALVSATVPVAAGLALGDRPSQLALAGVAISIPAVVLVSVEPRGAHGAPYAVSPRERVAAQAHVNRTRALSLVAGLGFGMFFVALSRTSSEAGLFPLLSARVASIVVLASILTSRRRWAPIGRSSWPVIAVAGILDFAANGFYLTALGKGTFTWVAAISSLYPVSTVVLARIVLGERLRAIQIGGLALAGGALALVAVGR